MRKAVIVLFLAVALVGCAAAPKVAFEAEARKSIKRIAIIETPEPDKYTMNPGQLPAGFVLYAFGALGGAILGGIEGSRIESASKSLTDAISPFRPNMHSTFQQQIVAGLKAKGYEVALVPAPPKSADGKNYDLTKVGGAFDAFLSGTLNGGYTMEGSRAVPRLIGSVTLVAKSGDHTYFAQNYVYGSLKLKDWVQIPPEGRFVFESADALYKNGQLAAEAMKVGASKIANEVIAQF